MPGKTFNEITGDTETGGQNEQPPVVIHPEAVPAEEAPQQE